MQESLQGPCNGHFNRWYFEANKMMCVPFVYGGCRGNRNNFLTAEECNEGCKIVRGKIFSLATKLARSNIFELLQMDCWEILT